MPLGDFVCPRCGDHYIAEADCDRCGVSTVVVDRTFFARAPSSPKDRPVLSGALVLAGLGATLLAAAMALYAANGAGDALNLAIPGGFYLLLGSGPTIGEVARRLQLWRRRRAMTAVPLATIESASAGTDARVRGRLRIEATPEGKRLSVVDESGKLRVRIATDGDATMFERDGETDYACDGDLVECVGTPHECLEGGEGYRERAVGVEIDARAMLVLERKRQA